MSTVCVLGNSSADLTEDKTSQLSWSSATEEKLECTTWDAEYIQQWLRLDETRSTLQQHRDMLELEYDRAELEDWSLSLSNDDLREQWKKLDAATPGKLLNILLLIYLHSKYVRITKDAFKTLSFTPPLHCKDLMTVLIGARAIIAKEGKFFKL